MAYKDILVVTDDTPECEERVSVALGVAARYDAHAIGMMVQEQVYVPRYATSGLPSSFLAEQREVEENARARVRERFERQAGNAGVRSEWYTAQGDPVKAVAPCSAGTRTSPSSARRIRRARASARARTSPSTWSSRAHDRSSSFLDVGMYPRGCGRSGSAGSPAA